MNRLVWIVCSLGLVATPALAQQPLTPAPQPGYAYPPNDPQYGTPPAQPQYDPYAQQQAAPYGEQPANPYDDDDDDDGYDVTYDVSAQAEPYDDGYDPNAYQQFESQLSPYGTWEDVPSYGHVWIPSTTVVGVDFAPYGTGGHFMLSDYGWTWMSDWDWGWAPFHYGRWVVAGGYGWCWVPGTTWGPAWVNWRWGGGYVGWAPMPPRGVVIGPPRGVRSPWHFTVAGQLGAVRPAYLPARVMPQVWGHTAVVNNVTRVNVGGAAVHVNAGPPAHLVAQAVGHPLAPVALNSVAPRALPRAAITPRINTPVAARPWMQSRPVGGSFARPAPGARTLGAPTAMQPRPMPLRTTTPYGAAPGYAGTYRAPATQPYRGYASPVYRAPSPAYRYGAQPAYHYAAPPAYHYNAPAPAYHYAPPAAYHAAPTYSAPSYHYNAPTYHAAPTYSAPQHFSAPSSSFGGGGFHGGGGAPAFHGGGGGGFHGGGRR